MEKKYKLALEDFDKYLDDTNTEMAIAKIGFISNLPNSHGIPITEDIVKQYASTILGKFVIADYDKFTKDASTHTSTQNIVGYIDKSQEIEFTYDNEGYIIANVEAVISKLYANDIYEMFKDNNGRNVSVEMLVEYNEDNSVNSLNICAVTILGEAFNPSIPNANMQIIQFSEDKAKEYYAEFSKNKTSKFETSVLEKLDSIENKLKEVKAGNMNDIKKEAMAVEIGDKLWSFIYDALEEKYPADDGWGSVYRIEGIYENLDMTKYVIICNEDGFYKVDFTYDEDNFELSDELIEVEKQFIEMSEDSEVKFKKFSKEEYDEYLASCNPSEKESDEPKVVEEVKKESEEEDEEEVDETELEVEKQEENVDEKPSEMQEIIKELSSEIEQLRSENETLTSQLNELQEFKNEKLSNDVKLKVEETLSQVKDKLDTETYKKFEESGLNCDIETVEKWSNEVFAVYGRQMLKMSVNDNNNNMLNVEIPKDKTKSKKDGLWETL